MFVHAAAQHTQRTPRFNDYPVKEIFKGKPAAPIIVTREQRLFRTRIREGVAAGRPNFAGHYTVVTWACGSPCEMMAIVDAATGKVYNPPISTGFSLPPLPETVPGNPDSSVPWPALVEFRRDSNLMVEKANPDVTKGRKNYAHYFLWDNNHWKLIRRIPIPTEAAP
jgi:hypothetical protein